MCDVIANTDFAFQSQACLEFELCIQTQLHHRNNTLRGRYSCSKKKGNRLLMVNTGLRHHLSRQRHLCVPETKGLIVTRTSPLHMRPHFLCFSPRTSSFLFFSFFFVFLSLQVDRLTHLTPEWQSRLRSLLQQAAALCTRLTSVCFEACHATSLFSIQEADSRSCPAVRSGFLWCRLLHHCTKRPSLVPPPPPLLSRKARVVEIFGRALLAEPSRAEPSRAHGAAFASCMWPLRWRNAESLHLRQCAPAAKNVLKFDTRGGKQQRSGREGETRRFTHRGGHAKMRSLAVVAALVGKMTSWNTLFQ